MAYPATAVNSDACRLVDDQQTFILEEHVIRDRGAERSRRGRAFPVDTHRWYPDLVAVGEPVFGPDSTAVHPHFAASKQPVEAPFRDPREFAA